MKKLFICERPYPLYRTLLKAAANTQDEMDIVIADHTPGMSKMVEPLRNSGLFKNVFFFDDANYQRFSALRVPSHTYKNKSFMKTLKTKHIPMLKKLFGYFAISHKAKQIVLPEGLNPENYDEIYVNDATSSINLHLFHRHINVIWVEHAKGALALHSSEYFATILSILEHLRLTFALRGMCRFVKAIEVENRKGLLRQLHKKDVREVPIDALVNALSPGHREQIFQLFREAYAIPYEEGRPVDILLTNPLFADRDVSSFEEQREVYCKVIATHMHDADSIFIKPHPRDTLPYQELFPDYYVVPNCISAEIFALSSSLKIRKAVTIYSTTIQSFINAEKQITLGKDAISAYLQ